MNKKRKTRKKQFSIITFKISKQQKHALTEFCEHHDITLIKLIKRSIARYTNYKPSKNPKPVIHPKQLDLLDEIENNQL